MELSVTFRHMEPSDALKDYVQDRTNKLTKYIDRPLDSQVTLSVQKFRQIADVVINFSSSVSVVSFPRIYFPFSRKIRLSRY